MREHTLRRLQYHREQRKVIRNRIADALTWKQFHAWQAGELKTRSNKILKLLYQETMHRDCAKAARESLDRIEKFQVIQGEKHAWFPSHPVGKLALVAV